MPDLTVRETAVEALEALIRGIEIGVPADDPYDVKFSEVFREPPGDIGKGKRAWAILQEGTEQKTELNNPKVDCSLAMTLELHVSKEPSEKMSIVLNKYLGAVDRALRADRTLGGVCYEMEITAGEISPEGVYAYYGACVILLNLRYRHHTDDPRVRV